MNLGRDLKAAPLHNLRRETEKNTHLKVLKYPVPIAVIR